MPLKAGPDAEARAIVPSAELADSVVSVALVTLCSPDAATVHEEEESAIMRLIPAAQYRTNRAIFMIVEGSGLIRHKTLHNHGIWCSRGQ